MLVRILEIQSFGKTARRLRRLRVPLRLVRGCIFADSSRRRPAYTLLEVLLASAIGVLLMGGLYVAVDVQLRHAPAGPEVVQQGTPARALLARMTSHINASVGPVQPVVTGSSGSGGAGGAMSSGGGGRASRRTSGAPGTGAGATATSTPARSSSAPAGDPPQDTPFPR